MNDTISIIAVIIIVAIGFGLFAISDLTRISLMKSVMQFLFWVIGIGSFEMLNRLNNNLKILDTSTTNAQIIASGVGVLISIVLAFMSTGIIIIGLDVAENIIRRK